MTGKRLLSFLAGSLFLIDSFSRLAYTINTNE